MRKLAAGVAAFVLFSVPTGSTAREPDTPGCSESGRLRADELPSRVPPEDCDLRGRIIEDHGVALGVPPPDRFVHVGSIGPAPEELLIATEGDGTVVISHAGSEGDAVSTDGGGGGNYPGACLDDEFNQGDFRELDVHRWAINTRYIPDYLNQANAITAIRQGINNWVHTVNDCGFSDSIDIEQNYLGSTQARADYDGETCRPYGQQDGQSVVDFKAADDDPGVDLYGLECTWGGAIARYEVDTSDVVLDRENEWRVLAGGDNCTNQIDIENVMTHERGHTFGLDHVNEDLHGNLTMSRYTTACEIRQRTLGWGDIRGANVHGY